LFSCWRCPPLRGPLPIFLKKEEIWEKEEDSRSFLWEEPAFPPPPLFRWGGKLGFFFPSVVRYGKIDPSSFLPVVKQKAVDHFFPVFLQSDVEKSFSLSPPSGFDFGVSFFFRRKKKGTLPFSSQAAACLFSSSDKEGGR